MASNIINGSVTNKADIFSFYLEWSVEQNILENYSDVTVKAYWSTNNTNHTFNTVSSRSASITIDGVTTSISKVFSVYWDSNPYLIQTVTQRVYHNSDGQKTITVSARANGRASNYGPSSTTSKSDDCVASGIIVLPAISRESSISSLTSNVAINGTNKVTVSIDSHNDNFVHTVQFYINSKYAETLSNVKKTTSYIIPTSWLKAIPSATSCTAYCKITTYNGSVAEENKIGSSVRKSFVVTVPSDVVPTVGNILLDPVDLNGQNVLIQGKNKLTISVSGCAAGDGSSIKSYTFSGPGISDTTTNTSVTSSGTISTSGQLTYRVTVTDERGRSAYKEETIECHEWTPPYFKSFNAYRVDSDSSEVENSSGTYVRCEYELEYSSVNNTNDVTVQIFYKKNSSGDWINNMVLEDSTNTSGSHFLSNIDATMTYITYAKITDNYGGSSQSIQVVVFGESRVVNVTEDGTGVAFGKMAEYSELLESKYKIKAPGIVSSRASYRPEDISFLTDSSRRSCIEHYLADTSKIEDNGNDHGGLPGDGHIIHCHWDGSDGYLGTQLYLKHSDGRILSRGCDTTGTWGSWRTVIDDKNYTDYVLKKPTMLYSGDPTSGTVVLSDSASNYSYMEIFYIDNNSVNGSECQGIKIYAPNNRSIQLSMCDSGNNSIIMCTSRWVISGTTITHSQSAVSTISANSVSTNSEQQIRIWRVFGYK